MKFIYVFIFLLVLSCNTVKKDYVCGDHPCIDKKEFNEYFSKNLKIKIKQQKKKQKNKIDLVKLNTDSSVVEKNENKNSKKKEQIRIKIEKEKLKTKKTKLLEERKIRKSEENNIVAAEKIAKLNEKKEKFKKNKVSNNRIKVNKIFDNIYEEKKPTDKDTKKNIFTNSTKSDNMKSICDKIKDCDIDKITELLIKKGKDKPFPNISSN